MGNWIPSRGINGEWGYINLETGQFSNVIPGSEEEKRQDLIKQQKAALLTHSARQAKFDQAEGKRRNHSSERKQKKVDVPILRVNPDGTFTNTYTEQLAPYESSMRIVSPEFDLIALTPGIKSLQKLIPKTKYRYSQGISKYFRKDKYIKDNQWNTDQIRKEMLQGKSGAINYFNSDLRKKVLAHNIDEANKLGFHNYRPSQTESMSAATAKYQATVKPNESWAGRTTGQNTEINVISDDIENATFHEALHNGKLASTDPQLPNESFEQYVARAKDTAKYMEYKTNQLLKPYKDIPDNLKTAYQYVEKPYEAAANYFELGRRLGLKPGQSYPGDDIVKRLIQYVPRAKELQYKGGLVELVRTDRQGLQNFWKALTGQYYVYPIGVVFGQSLVSKTPKK